MIRELDDDRTFTAWQTFVTEGTLLLDYVRPEIARSWQRCREFNLHPWSLVPKPDHAKLQGKRRKYMALLPIVTPAVEYIKVLMDANGLMADAKGFVYELLSPIKNYPRSLGTYQTERNYGTYSTTITLAEQMASRTDGYEHYLIVGHARSCASAPVFDSHHKLAGVLSAVRTYKRLPPAALACVTSLAQLIESSLYSRDATLNVTRHPDIFQSAIDSCPQGVLVLHHTGAMIAMNAALRKMLSPDGADGPFARSSEACPFLKPRELSILTNENLHAGERRLITFRNPASSPKDDTKRKLLLSRANRIHLPNRETHVVLIFEEDNTETSKHPMQSVSSAGPAKAALDAASTISIGESAAWKAVNAQLLQIAPFVSNVLLQGESGTGKEVVAHLLHTISNRKGPFVAVNCGAYPKDLLYGELFGYKGGAFTGAQKNGLVGKFEFAHTGTLFLDEIGEMPLDSQSSLLRAIDDRTIVRFGSNQSIKTDILIIAASNKKLDELLDQGAFRKDLYYRLSAVEISLPPLRERKTDIPELADYFASEFCKNFHLATLGIRDDALQLLYNYDWPGNVRELRNVIERALILTGGGMITPEALPAHILLCPTVAVAAREVPANDSTSDDVELLTREFRKNKGNLAKTARAFNVSRVTLYRRLERHHINIETFRQK